MTQDWMDRIEATTAEKAQSENTKRAHELMIEQAFQRMAPPFVAAVFAGLDADVSRWNSRPSLVKVVTVEATAFVRSYQTVERLLKVRYSQEQRSIEVDIEINANGIVAPNIAADSYALAVRDARIVGMRRNGARGGWASSPDEISEEILTALLT
jgi:hypothetical protein